MTGIARLGVHCQARVPVALSTWVRPCLQAGIEEEYKLKNDKAFTWKALRLMASGELRSIRAALVKWVEIISEADAAREKMWGAVGRMRNTKLAAGFLGWLGAVEAIATAKALMALCVRTFINKVLLLPGQTYELPPPLSTLSPSPIPTGDCFGVALVDGIRRRLPPDAQMRALVPAPRPRGIGARVGSDG